MEKNGHWRVENCRQDQARSRAQTYHMLEGKVVGRGKHNSGGRSPRANIHLGEPLGMEPAAGLVELAARRPARECLLGDRSLVHTRYFHRVPRCGQPRPTWRRAYTNPGPGFPALHSGRSGIKQRL